MKRSKILFFLLLATVAGLCLLQAGSLEPPGPPGPTMVSLEKIPSSWHQQLGLLRFELVFNGAAVLDHETGLVWQRVVNESGTVWKVAVRYCRSQLIGDRYGWRLPSVEELATLVDVNQSNPALPPLHPFIADSGTGGAGQFVEYWTSSTSTENSGNAWTVSFEGNGALLPTRDKFDISGLGYFGTWCVRGGVALDTGRP